MHTNVVRLPAIGRFSGVGLGMIEARSNQAWLDRNTAALIADLGQPRWPGWQLLAILLIAAQIAAVIATHDEGLRIRPRDLRIRRVTLEDTNAVRGARRVA